MVLIKLQVYSKPLSWLPVAMVMHPLMYHMRMVGFLRYRIAQNFGGENFGEFGETIVIRQYFTQPNSRFTIVTKGKFANVFLAKTLKRSICQSFTPPTFCTI